MANAPETLTLKRNRDLDGLSRRPYTRWVVLTLIAVAAVLGLANVFGQRPSSVSAETSDAKLTLYAPNHLRGGLLASNRFHITARSDLKDARLVLDPGWAEGMSINTVEPSPLGEASDDGRLSFDLGHVPAGRSYILWIQFQVNATNIAWRRPANVALYDGDRRLLTIHHHLTIYP